MHKTPQALKYIDYARLQNYDISQMLSYELSAMCLHLTEDNCIRKSNKSELLSRLREDKLEKQSPKVSERNYRSMIVIDIMANARRVPVKKSQINYNTNLCLSRNCDRVDIVLELYLEKSIKQSERGRRKKSTASNVSIQCADQHLLVSMDSFWASSTNKEQLQQFVIIWLINT